MASSFHFVKSKSAKDQKPVSRARQEGPLCIDCCRFAALRQPTKWARSGENWKEPASGEWIRTFAVITTDANELVAEIHDRMPLNSRAWRLCTLAERRARSRRFDAAVPGRTPADVADLDPGQQAGKRRSLDRRANRVGHLCCVGRAKLTALERGATGYFGDKGGLRKNGMPIGVRSRFAMQNLESAEKESPSNPESFLVSALAPVYPQSQWRCDRHAAHHQSASPTLPARRIFGTCDAHCRVHEFPEFLRVALSHPVFRVEVDFDCIIAVLAR